MSWFFVNVLVPFVIPFTFLSLLKLPHLPDKVAKRAGLIPAIKDGQLCWSSMAMSAAALYELWGAWGKTSVDAWFVGFMLVVQVLLLAVSAVMVTTGTLYPAELHTNLTYAGWLKHYRLLVASVVVAILVGGCYTLVHQVLPRP